MKKDISSEEFYEQFFKVTPEKVANVITILAAFYNPLCIYVFGSYARGKHDRDSDLDVLVVVDKLDDTSWNVIAKGYGQLHDAMMPVDLLVYDKNSFDQCKLNFT